MIKKVGTLLLVGLFLSSASMAGQERKLLHQLFMSGDTNPNDTSPKYIKNIQLQHQELIPFKKPVFTITTND